MLSEYSGKIGGTFLSQGGSLEYKHSEYKVFHKEEQLFLELESTITQNEEM